MGWIVEGTWEYDGDDEEIIIEITKEAVGGPRRDRDIKMPVSEDLTTLTFRKTECKWSLPLPDKDAQKMASMSIKELKLAAQTAGINADGCIEREDFEKLIRRASLSGTNALAPPVQKESPKKTPPVAKDQAPVAPAQSAKAVEPPSAAPVAASPETPVASPPAAEAPAAAPMPTVAPEESAPPVVPGAAATAGCYTLEELTDKRTWEKLPDVVATERETYLLDDVFNELFGMPKAEFAKLPKWKRDTTKKKHNLF